MLNGFHSPPPPPHPHHLYASSGILSSRTMRVQEVDRRAHHRTWTLARWPACLAEGQGVEALGREASTAVHCSRCWRAWVGERGPAWAYLRCRIRRWPLPHSWCNSRCGFDPLCLAFEAGGSPLRDECNGGVPDKFHPKMRPQLSAGANRSCMVGREGQRMNLPEAKNRVYSVCFGSATLLPQR